MSRQSPPLSISIDGPSAGGKTTLGCALAGALGLAFLDTGLSFRAGAYAASRHGAPLDPAAFLAAIDHTPAVYEPGAIAPSRDEAVLFEGMDITADLRSPRLEADLKLIAGDQCLREVILAMHRRVVMTARHRIVVVGRDVAETLLPIANLHIYLTAELGLRRERRRAQFEDGQGSTSEVERPSPRDLKNLTAVRMAANSLEVDSSRLSAQAVFEIVMARLAEGR